MDISGDAADLVARLPGLWQVARVVRQGDGSWTRFAGTARWAPEGDGLRCVEAGEMAQGALRLAARRETLWRVAAGRVQVDFPDGRPFHDFAPADAVEAHHWCAPDSYVLRYDFRAAGFWSCRWRVTGPRKDYRALSRYWRG